MTHSAEFSNDFTLIFNEVYILNRCEKKIKLFITDICCQTIFRFKSEMKEQAQSKSAVLLP